MSKAYPKKSPDPQTTGGGKYRPEPAQTAKPSVSVTQSASKETRRTERSPKVSKNQEECERRQKRGVECAEPTRHTKDDEAEASAPQSPDHDQSEPALEEEYQPPIRKAEGNLSAKENAERKLVGRQHAEQLMGDIKDLCEPLRGIFRSSPIAKDIPMTWFCVTLLTFFDQADRDFAARAQREDPALLRAFVLADINIACRDARINTNQKRGLVRYKYNLTGGRLALMMGVSSLNDLLAHTRREAVYPGPRYYANITAKRDTQGDMVIYSHFHSDMGKPFMKASDELIKSFRNKEKGKRSPGQTEEATGSGEPPSFRPASYEPYYRSGTYKHQGEKGKKEGKHGAKDPPESHPKNSGNQNTPQEMSKTVKPGVTTVHQAEPIVPAPSRPKTVMTNEDAQIVPAPKEGKRDNDGSENWQDPKAKMPNADIGSKVPQNASTKQSVSNDPTGPRDVAIPGGKETDAMMGKNPPTTRPCATAGSGTWGATEQRKKRIRDTVEEMSAARRWESIQGKVVYRSHLQNEGNLRPVDPRPQPPPAKGQQQSKTKQQPVLKQVPIQVLLSRHRNQADREEGSQQQHRNHESAQKRNSQQGGLRKM